MSVSEKLDKLYSHIDDSYNKVLEKGGTVPENKNTENLANAIDSISGGASYNVFAQEEEPASKDGVWIKSNTHINDTCFINSMSAQGDFTIEGLGVLYTSEAIVGQVVVGDYLYSFGKDSSKSWKYNLRTKEKVGNLNVPKIYTTGGSCACYYAPTNKIYVFCHIVDSSNTKCYTYNIADDTYEITKMSTYGDCLFATIVNDTICMVKIMPSGNQSRQYFVKFSADTFSTLYTSGEISGYNGTLFEHNSKIYSALIGGYLYSIDCITNQQASVKNNLGLDTASKMIVWLDDKYIFYIKFGSQNKYYIYNRETETITEKPLGFSWGSNTSSSKYNSYNYVVDQVKGVVYMRLASNTVFAVKTTSFDSADYNNDSLLIWQSNTENRATMTNNGLMVGIKDVYALRSSNLNEYLTFWGNGERWNLLKNPTGETTPITFDTTGGTEISQLEVVIGQLATAPEPPTKVDYTFDCWYLNDKPFDFTAKILKPITLTAHWIPNYNVTFNSNGGSEVATQSITTGLTASVPEIPTKDGFEFNGWYLEDEEFDFSTPITNHITLVAHWLAVYSVSFDSDGGSEIETQYVAEGDVAVEPEIPIKDGYEFSCWTLSGEQFDFSIPITSDIELLATYTQVEV